MKEGNAITKLTDYDVLTVNELCELLDISKKYAYQFIRDNKIKFIRIGKKIYISNKSLEKYLRMED